MRLLTDFFAAVPWFLPGTIVWAVASMALAPRLGRRLHASRPLAFTLSLSLGFVLLATLTPTTDALGGLGAPVMGCDLGRLTLAPPSELLSINDTPRNVMLFVPLGLALGLLQRTKLTAALIVLAYLLPFIIEGLQLVLTSLGRGCQSADVIDNATGLTIGLVAGSGLRGVIRWWSRYVVP